MVLWPTSGGVPLETSSLGPLLIFMATHLERSPCGSFGSGFQPSTHLLFTIFKPMSLAFHVMSVLALWDSIFSNSLSRTFFTLSSGSGSPVLSSTAPLLVGPIRVSCWHDVHDMGNWRCLVQGWLSSDDLRRWIQQVSVERVILQCFQVSLCWSPFASLFLAAGFLWRSCTGTAMWLIPSISLEPHLPRKVKVDVAKCHAGHAECTLMSPSATPATQTARHQPEVPHLPCKVKVDVTTCHACHAECTSMWQSAMPARRIHVEVAKRHACHANSRDNHKTQARHQSQPSPISATPATQSEGRCHQMRVSCVCVRELCVCVCM